jgi:hypothetical protein
MMEKPSWKGSEKIVCFPACSVARVGDCRDSATMVLGNPGNSLLTRPVPHIKLAPDPASGPGGYLAGGPNGTEFHARIGYSDFPGPR